MKIKVKDVYTGQIGTMDDSEMSARYQPIQETQTSQPVVSTSQPKQSVASSILGFLFPQTKNVVQDISASGKVGDYENKMTGSGSAVDIANKISAAKKSGNTQLLQQLLTKSKQISGQGDQIQSPEFSKDINRSYLRRGVGVAGELGPIIAGFSPGMVGKNITGKLAGTKIGALSGLIGGATGENVNNLGDAFSSGLGGAAVGGVIGGASDILRGILNKSGSTLNKAGTGLIQSQYNVPRSAANSLQLNKTVNELADYGITNINKVSEIAPKITGDSGVITKITRDSIAKAKPVNTDELLKIVQNIADDPSIQPGQDKKLVSFLKKGIQSLTDKSGVKGKFEANPLDTFDFIQDLEKKAASMVKGKPSYMISAQDQSMSNAYKLFADELKDRLFTQSGADDLVMDTASKIDLSEIPTKLAEKIRSAKTLGELRSLAAPFVRGSQAATITESGQNLATNTMGGAATGLGKLVQNPLNLAAIPLSSNTVNAGAGNLLRKISGAPSVDGNVVGKTQSALIPLLTNILRGNISPEQPTQNTQNNTYTGTNAPQNQIQSNNVQDNVNQQASIPQNGFTSEKLAAAIALDPKNASTYQQIYKALNPKGGTKSAAATQVEGKANAGLNAINRVEQIISKDPSILVKSSIPGSPGAREYDAYISSITDALGGLRTGASVSPQQQAFYKKMLPKVGDSPATIKAKIEAVRTELQGYANANVGDSTDVLQSLISQ